ncbi:GMC family oxidoreductase N-terminal domain-containing protein [Mycobacteroides abscessus]|uniref:GMC family oxidoreductase n=3 Tax=Mycobacteroides abscessus TaxID=36809 RepID=UPI00078CB04D|nr:GMC oxidoreductase [Mycobacteroides abscessus]AMU72246.1 glucose-methanol-choline oxidoreductase [Mycobacteroides abscessus]MDM2017109.1 GMC family oxidoreductase N-terminal domain-containing protein [Mycobacteroides abscessus]MDM2019065.1 GMC family oxidoreductase N-terminal domain-containing protein [Mycobacteroides abscessus]MDM2026613.1 GMC family oxidoreductase N-terminal domain-containing protein [Mycobacteroides abscessus]MDM2030955.1 GMC family oxidoreductase N-terminal domain-conta
MAYDRSHFDFIVVGGGTAGNVVASRLAENPNVKVLIVEAGVGNPWDVELVSTPGLAMDIRHTENDWDYSATFVDRGVWRRTDKNCTRGRALGGSSAGNYFSWIPGCRPTYDRWAEYGGQEWTWEPLLPYLRKSATYHDDDGTFPSDLHKIGVDGPLPISHNLIPELKAFRDVVTQAWTSRGLPLTDNIFDGEMNGLTHAVNSIYKGVRSGSYLFVKGKPNITILSEVRSKRLIIDYATRTAKGVTIIDGLGNEHDFHATREVILSQGVFESPKLLMLSGIGPARELAKHGIPVIVDSRHVGQHLLDHPGVPFVLRIKEGYALDSTLLRDGPKKDAAIAAYQKDHSGPLGSGFLEMIGFPRIDSYLQKDPIYREAKAANGGVDPFSPEGQPHFELDFVPAFGSAFQWQYPTPPEGDHVTVMVDIVRPTYEGGNVTLNSVDPLEQPKIKLNYLSNELDIIGLREGVRFAYDILTKGDGFKDIVIDQYPWEMPLESDELMQASIQDRVQTSYHPCGTNRLSKNIDQGVVDPKLKVHGVNKLRVIDASVFPIIPDCRIQNTVYMVGEKGADLIKADHTDLYK